MRRGASPIRKGLLPALAAVVLFGTAASAGAWGRPSDLARPIEWVNAAWPQSAPARAPVALPVMLPVAKAQKLDGPTMVAASTVFRRPGLLNGIVSGFLNAGVIGLVLGYGFFDEIGGIASLVGLFLQLALLFVVVRLSWVWWQRRSAPETVGLTPRQLADEYVRPLPSRARETNNALAALDTLAPITESDMATFERLLREVKRAYAVRDLSALRALVTADLFDLLLARSNGETARGEGVSDVRLLDSGFAGRWREGEADYARLTLRFSLAEHAREHTNENGFVAADTRTVEAIEVWTFVRTAGGDWRVSAIQ